jgi:hypothetical protein
MSQKLFDFYRLEHERHIMALFLCIGLFLSANSCAYLIESKKVKLIEKKEN